jgi:branched-subunit amino acid aminotransferase/4-amino-4-deoxychorismate lyase
MGFTPTETIWFNGKLVPWGEAKVHVLAHALQYGTGVFEGMRSYETADGPAIFRLDAHLERFYKSARPVRPGDSLYAAVLTDASLEVIRANKLEVAYLRPIAFFDAATLSVWTKECPVTVAIAAVPTGKYLANADAGVARDRLAGPEVRQQCDPRLGQGLRAVHQLGARRERRAAPRVRRSAAPQFQGPGRRRIGLKTCSS